VCERERERERDNDFTDLNIFDVRLPCPICGTILHASSQIFKRYVFKNILVRIWMSEKTTDRGFASAHLSNLVS
jgi:hypothetical protein